MMPHEELATKLMERSFLTRGHDEPPFVLASGQTSHHYFDCERTTTFARALPLIGRAFFDELLPGVAAVGGPTRGADPIADAVGYYSVLQDRPVNVFSVRMQLKEAHGIEVWVEGSAAPGDSVAFVDDVVTSGSSVVVAMSRCRASGLRIAQVIVLVDREEQGGLQRIQDAAGPTVPVKAIFRYSELLSFQEARREKTVSRVDRVLSGAGWESMNEEQPPAANLDAYHERLNALLLAMKSAVLRMCLSTDEPALKSAWAAWQECK